MVGRVAFVLTLLVVVALLGGVISVALPHFFLLDLRIRHAVLLGYVKRACEYREELEAPAPEEAENCEYQHDDDDDPENAHERSFCRCRGITVDGAKRMRVTGASE